MLDKAECFSLLCWSISDGEKSFVYSMSSYCVCLMFARKARAYRIGAINTWVGFNPCLEMLDKVKHFSLFCWSISDAEKSFV